METNVEQIQGVLEGHQVQLLKDISVLDKMYEMNLVYFKELTMYILAGKKKLACWEFASPSASTIWLFHSGMVFTSVVWIFSIMSIS